MRPSKEAILAAVRFVKNNPTKFDRGCAIITLIKNKGRGRTPGKQLKFGKRIQVSGDHPAVYLARTLPGKPQSKAKKRALDYSTRKNGKKKLVYSVPWHTTTLEIIYQIKAFLIAPPFK